MPTETTERNYPIRVGNALPNAWTLLQAKPVGEYWVVLAFNPTNYDPFATWLSDGNGITETGHYYHEAVTAVKDFESRYTFHRKYCRKESER
ncbi:MAG: hypothetical protein FJZ95_03440 [Chloroflexi bacterium]|nr:hypothetical protein [Chloroflexota bacterium]